MSQSLQERIAAFPFWDHKIELPGGIVTLLRVYIEGTQVEKPLS
ncbi:MAG: hypothetical protein WBV73_09910 [Phormidium sp.]